MAQEVEYPVLTEAGENPPAEAIQVPKAGRKRASSKARVVSTASTASKASLRAVVPDDSMIEAELAAELDKPLSEEEDVEEAPQQVEEPKKKRKNGKAAASTASVRPVTVESQEHQESILSVAESQLEPMAEKGKKKPRTTKGKGKKKPATEEETTSAPAPVDPSSKDQPDIAMAQAEEPHSQILEQGPAHDSDVEMVDPPKAKKGSKKKAASRPKAQKKDTSSIMEVTEAEVPVQAEPVDAPSMEALLQAMPQPPKGRKHSKAKGKPEALEPRMPGAFDTEELPEVQQTATDPEPEPIKTVSPASPQRSKKEVTPSPSPQSSDAENQPPSSRPSTRRPPLLPVSPSRTQAIQIPLAQTPKQSPSKLNRPIAGLSTSRPWAAVDVEMIFAPSPGCVDKENMFANINGPLTSPEKRMTVEQWISHLAQQSEGHLKEECERVVGIFEKEGSRAMMALEGVDCVE